MKIPGWTIDGVVTEVRPLKTKEGKVFAYSVGVMAFGGTYELTTRDESLTKKIGAGSEVHTTGTFSTYNGRLKLDLATITPAKAG